MSELLQNPDNPYEPLSAEAPQEPVITEEFSGPRGIGGWLLLPLFGLIFSPSWFFFLIITKFVPLFSEGAWETLTTPGNDSYHPLWAPLLVIGFAGSLLLTVFCIFLLFLFFKKSYLFPRLYITYLLTNMLFKAGYFYFSSYIPSIRIRSAQEGLPMIIAGAMIGALIWVAYFLRSRRVKNTFVKKAAPVL